MKFLILIISSCSIMALGSSPKTWYINDIYSQGTTEEMSNLEKVLNDFDTIYEKHPATGKQSMKVVRVAKGSLYERIGVKIGDFIENGNSTAARNKKR